MKSSALVLASLLALGSTASADTKSWTALKGKFPAGTNVVVSLDVNAIAKTPSYGILVQKFLAEANEAKQAFDLVKTTCGIDVTTSISDITLFGAIPHDDKLSVAVGLNGLDEAKILDCLQKITDQKSGKAAGVKKITAKTKGKVTEYSAAGETEKIYLGWLAKDVVVVAPEQITEKGVLDKVLAGKAAKGDFKIMLGKVNKASPLFGVVAIKETEDGINFTGGFGDVTMASGAFTAAIHVMTTKAEEAARVVEMGKAAVQEGVKEMNDKKQPDLAKVIGSATFSSAGTEVIITGTISEAVLLKVLPDLDKVF